MTSRLRVQHVSRYSYQHPINASFNEARLTPMATRWQQPLDTFVQVPEATWQYQYVDYWGTRVRVFEAQRPHLQLVVHASSVVELDATQLPAPDRGLSWESLRSAATRERFGELLRQSPATAPEPALAALAASIAAENDPHQTALAICTRIHQEMDYLPGSTGVHTAAREAWLARSGVCQDYAHVVIGALRHVGLPARYVSGYLHPNPDAAIGETSTGQSHAWVEWWLTDWVGHDPTNDSPLGEHHVLVGRGRDYADVPPIKGIVAGISAAAELEVSVEVTRLA
ncbi:MAG TPA: transglutaminase family protein [Jatrophihabitantaceae bacterium]|jgi:transglutaminase-like putative cysteine protease|nr:transglutaminase family protein [Jatrophihabitantaceae bacterium]